ncbi:MAG: regulatory protein RecX [Oscillospiraceae bacterium]|nr:regulatory protein RecX [Oscillospiraceae bacterium]
MRKQQPLTTYDAVKEKALRLLEFRSHSEKELADKLRRYDASEENIELTLDFCRRYGFVNDASFAKRKAHDLFNLKKLGTRRIRNELKMLGIPDEYITEALYELDDEKEQETLLNLAEKKLRGDFSDKNKDKCIRFLIYRGYDIYAIKEAISTLEAIDEI